MSAAALSRCCQLAGTPKLADIRACRCLPLLTLLDRPSASHIGSSCSRPSPPGRPAAGHCHHTSVSTVCAAVVAARTRQCLGSAASGNRVLRVAAPATTQPMPSPSPALLCRNPCTAARPSCVNRPCKPYTCPLGNLCLDDFCTCDHLCISPVSWGGACLCGQPIAHISQLPAAV